MNKEIWKDIKDYEGLYQVSNYGNVRSLNYHLTKKVKNMKFNQDKDGYYGVTLCKNNNKKTKKIHRLVAETFIPNPNRYPIINHKDEDILNNRVENLEWCTHEYNMNYGTCQKRKGEKKRIKVKQYDKNWKYLKTFDSIKEANIYCGKDKDWSNIARVKRDLNALIFGYHWKYETMEQSKAVIDEIKSEEPTTEQLMGGD